MPCPANQGAQSRAFGQRVWMGRSRAAWDLGLGPRAGDQSWPSSFPQDNQQLPRKVPPAPACQGTPDHTLLRGLLYSCVSGGLREARLPTGPPGRHSLGPVLASGHRQ